MEVILEMSFLIFNNVNIQFAEKELIWRSYITEQALTTICWVELIEKKEFAKTALNENVKAFVIYMAFFILKMSIHPAQEAQTDFFIAKKVNVPAEYLDFANVFSKKSAEMLPKRTKINKHAIKLKDGKQPSYRPIYSLGSVELETLKTYIKTNLANGFIWPLKSPTGAPIVFVYKPNSSF